MSRVDGGRAEMIALSFWDGREAVEGFGGPTSAVVLYPEDGRSLLEPSTITHYEMAG